MIENRYQRAVDYVVDPDLNGEPFPVGMCKQRTRLAYDVASDGSVDATEAWGRTRHRLPGNRWIAGMLVWWVGGSAGHGHVAFADKEVGWIHTVDYPVAGRWNRIPMDQLEAAWPSIRYAGASLDIDGVQVIPDPAPIPTPVIDHAVDDLEQAIAARKPGRARRALRAARQATLRARQIVKGRA